MKDLPKQMKLLPNEMHAFPDEKYVYQDEKLAQVCMAILDQLIKTLPITFNLDHHQPDKYFHQILHPVLMCEITFWLGYFKPYPKIFEMAHVIVLLMVHAMMKF